MAQFGHTGCVCVLIYLLTEKSSSWDVKGTYTKKSLKSKPWHANLSEMAAGYVLLILTDYKFLEIISGPNFKIEF